MHKMFKTPIFSSKSKIHKCSNFENEWKSVFLLLMAFGGFQRNSSLPSTDLREKARKFLLILLRIYWEIGNVYLIANTLHLAIKPRRNAHYVRIISMVFVIILHYILRIRAAKLFKVSREMQLQMKGQIPQTNYWNINTFFNVYCLMILLAVALDVFKVFRREVSTHRLIDRISFYVIPADRSQVHSISTKLYLVLTMTPADTLLFTTPAMSTAVCCMAQIMKRRLLRDYNQMFEGKLRNGMEPITLAYIIKSLSRISIQVKDINNLMSPLIAILIIHQVANSCYVISRFFDDDLPMIYLQISISVISFGIGMMQLVAIVVFSSQAEDEILQLEAILFRTVKEDISSFFDQTKAVNALLLRSVLKGFRKEVVLHPLGFFKLERKLILVVLGMVFSYEIFMVQNVV